jgi:hypothetical protein
MNRGIYTEHNDQLEDRVKRNIHFIQRKVGNSIQQEEDRVI